MDLTVLSTNLRRVRAGRKLSQADVAEQAGLSREGYRRIEEGIVEPRVESLRRVASALGVKADDLLVPVRQLRSVRFRAQKKMTSREDLLANVARWLDDYSELEGLLDRREPFQLAALARTLGGEKNRDIVGAAQRAREALGLDQHELIRDICGLLEDHGVKVFTPSVASEGFFGLSVGEGDGGPAVVVNRWDRISVERWIFTAAHELGHLLLHLDAFDVAQAEEDETQEAEANLFATHFLMPEDLFEKEWAEARGLGLVERVFKIKRIFRVSWKTVVYRIASRSPDSAKIWPQFYSAYKRSTGRPLRGVEEPQGLDPQEFSASASTPVARAAEEPEHLSPCDFVEDRLLRLVKEGVDRGEISIGRAAEILDVDLKTMRSVAASWLE